MPKTPTRMKADAIAYCAECKKEYCKTEDKYLDINFPCPENKQNNPLHLARVVKGKPGKFWLRMEKRILTYEVNKCLRQRFGGPFKESAGLYLTVYFLILIVFLNLASSLCNQPSTGLIVWNAIIIILTLVLMFDNLAVNTSVAFISRFPTHPLRSTLMTIFAFVQVLISYSIFFIILGNNFNENLSPIRALYFSFVTITTLGYGEILPKSDSELAMLVIISELVIGLFFLVILLSLVTSWVSERPVKKKDEPLEKICPDYQRSTK